MPSGTCSRRRPVVRDGQRMTSPAEDLVPGDLVLLQSGDRVPADLRLIQAKPADRGVGADRRIVTVEKRTEPVAATPARRPPRWRSPERWWPGQGAGVVSPPATATEIGRISALLAHVEPLTHAADRQMDAFARRLTAHPGARGADPRVRRLVRGYSLGEMFMAAVGFAVAAIPEGLPAVITITLAIGVQRMARRNAIMRRLPAVETLGAVTVICSDKTGTLTRNEMTVRRSSPPSTYRGQRLGLRAGGRLRLEPVEAVALSAPAARRCDRAALLCNDASGPGRRRPGRWRASRRRERCSRSARKAGLDPASRRARPAHGRIPFESEHQFMATLHHDPGGERVSGQGRARARARHVRRERGPDGGGRWSGLLAPARRRARGARAAGAGGRDASGRRPSSGLQVRRRRGRPRAARPARPDRPAAAGGDGGVAPASRRHPGQDDHRRPCRDRARDRCQLGLADEPRVITGPELDGVGDDELRRRGATSRRLRAHQPGAQAAPGRGAAGRRRGGRDDRRRGQRRAGAEAGRCRGRHGHKGTEAAKEAADMVLADDNFASIARAVEEGRTVYDNLQKSSWSSCRPMAARRWRSSSRSCSGDLPITPVQILWINMVTAITLALALAFEPAEPDLMRRPPRDPGEPILSGSCSGASLGLGPVLAGVSACSCGPGPRAELGGSADHRGEHAGRARDRLPVQRPLSAGCLADLRACSVPGRC